MAVTVDPSAITLSRRGLLVSGAVLVVGCSSDSGVGSVTTAASTSGATTRASAPTSTSEVAATSVPLGTTNVAGTRTHTLELQGITREFIVHTPDAAAGDHAVPVVFMIHGTGGDGQRFLEGSGWRELADREGFIVVFPSSLTLCWLEDRNRDGDIADGDDVAVLTRWNAGQDGPDAPFCSAEQVAALPAGARRRLDHPLPDDMEFMRRMLAVLSSEYTVDRRRVSVTGFSNGGQMAARLMVELDEEFAAVAVAAGNLNVPAEPASHPLALVYSVGASDELFLEYTGISSIPLDESIFDIPLFAGIRDGFLTVGQLENEYTSSETRSNLGKVVTFTFATSAVGADNVFRFIVMEGLSHDYPRAMPAALWEVFGQARQVTR